jgi:methylthioribose-1-phosphate isomerase
MPDMASSGGAPYEAVGWHEGRLRLLDQTLLPADERYLEIADLDAACEAIRSMRVRGAPAIGIAAGYALAAEAARLAPHASGEAQLREALEAVAERLGATRPTAVNLRWALDRVLAAVASAETPEAVAAVAEAEASRLHEQQRDADWAMADAACALLSPPDDEAARAATVITHCNTGPLATGGLGTALGAVIEAHRRGLVADVLVDETRPRLQGARLTAWELARHGVPAHVIADGAAAWLVGQRGVTAALVGADRIAANGDTANKVGTLGLALACAHHGVPLYVVAPLSTVDLATADGAAIPVEERDEREVLEADGVALATPDARALNPAFDVTPAALITAIVTERGVLRSPYGRSLADSLAARPATAPP